RHGHAGLSGWPHGREAPARACALARVGSPSARDRVGARAVTGGRLRIGAVALALVGVAVSGYLLWVHEAGASIVCATGGCETVQHSPYAEHMAVAVPFLGVG